MPAIDYGSRTRSSKRHKSEEGSQNLLLKAGLDAGDDDDESVEVIDGAQFQRYFMRLRPSNSDGVVSNDAALARRLQEKEESYNAAAMASKQRAESSMDTKLSGKAWKFVNQVVELANQEKCKGIQAVAVDDMFFLVEQMMELQSKFAASNKDTTVDIGYHYTTSTNVTQISEDGLLTHAERKILSIDAKHNGSTYGDGIYTGNNPLAFHGRFGNIGLLVARLKGKSSMSKNKDDTTHTGKTGKEFNSMVVLRKSSQCVALIQFNASLIKRPPPTGQKKSRNSGIDRIVAIHKKLQVIVDAFFNDGRKTKVGELCNQTAPPATAVVRNVGTKQSGQLASASKKGAKNRSATARAPANKATPKQSAPKVAPAKLTRAKRSPRVAGAKSSAPPKAPVKKAASKQSAPAKAKTVAKRSAPNPSLQRTGPVLPVTSVASAPALALAIPPIAALPSGAPPLSNISASGSSTDPALLARGATKKPGARSRKKVAGSSTKQLTEVVVYTAPKEFKTPESALRSISTAGTQCAKDDCAICLTNLTDERKIVTINGCNHCFCLECIRAAIQVRPKCPTCQKPIGKPQGKMPSGTMTISTSTKMSCSSFGRGTIIIQYGIRGGTQRPYHDNPGVRFAGASRTAYVPDTEDGQKLLQRLKWAFSHGMTFT